MQPLIILGSGYTGEALLSAAPSAGFTPHPTSRTPAGRATPNGTAWIRFELHDEDTWANLPSARHYVWLFPAVPLDSVTRFAQHADLRSNRLVVVGTTSSFRQTQDGEEVDERTELDLTADRVKGEEYLRSIGATVLRASGIYGPALGPHPARSPLSWLRRGMIASPDSVVNLIHVSDLAAAILEALKRDLTGEQMIVSDGTPRRWGDIADWAIHSGLLTEARYPGSPSNGLRKLSKRLSNARLISCLGPVLTHADLFRELMRLEERGR